VCHTCARSLDVEKCSRGKREGEKSERRRERGREGERERERERGPIPRN